MSWKFQPLSAYAQGPLVHIVLRKSEASYLGFIIDPTDPDPIPPPPDDPIPPPAPDPIPPPPDDPIPPPPDDPVPPPDPDIYDHRDPLVAGTLVLCGPGQEGIARGGQGWWVVDNAMLFAWGDSDNITSRAHLIRCLQTVSKGHRANFLFVIDASEDHYEIVSDLVLSMGGLVLVPT
jgi:hypothetical protein